MKKRLMQFGIYVVLCAIILLLSCISAGATCAMTDHVYMAVSDNPYVEVFLRGTEEGDIWCIMEQQMCVMCGVRKTIPLPNAPEELRPHAMVYSKDEGHGNGVHYYRYSCMYCGFTRVDTVVCDGPPCRSMMMKKTDMIEAAQIGFEETEEDQ